MIKKILQGADTNLKDLLAGSVLTFAIKLLGITLTYLLFYIINLKNGAAGIGTYNLFVQLITVLGTTVCLGTNTSILKYSGQYHSTTDQPILSSVYFEICKYILLLCISLAVVLFFGAELFSNVIGSKNEYTLLVKCLALALPFFALNLITIELYRGIGLLRYSEFFRSILVPAVIVVGYLVLWNQQLTDDEIIYLFISSTVFSTLVSAFILRHNFTIEQKIIKKTIGISQILTTSIPMMISGTMGTLLTALPIFFINFYGSKQDVGVFSLNFKISQTITLILMIVNTILAPKIAFYYHAQRKNELQKLLWQSSRLMFWIALLLVLLLILFGKIILNFFGSEYIGSYSLLVILVMGNFVNVASGSVGIFMNMSGNEKKLIKLRLINLISCLAAYWIFIPRYGSLAAGIITSVEIIIFNIVTARYIKKVLHYTTYYFPFLKEKNTH
jgi:O-antigen/teichoic acid export membrane protein